jgi:formamidopyrimidine-DNA glycosylase
VPELPEVETYRRTFERHALGKTVAGVSVRDAGVLDGVTPRALAAAVRGRRVREVTRHGKIVFADLSPGPALVLRFGMTGDLVPFENGAVPQFARVLFRFAEGGGLAFTDMRKFGSIGLAPSSQAYLGERGVGPDALRAGAGPFVARAAARRAPIKAVLLDQALLAGVGNLYADEALFQAGVHPSTSAARLGAPGLRRLHAAVRRVLARAVANEADWERLPSSWLLPVRESGPCPHCGGPLRRLRIGGRTSVFCPERQRRGR